MRGGCRTVVRTDSVHQLRETSGLPSGGFGPRSIVKVGGSLLDLPDLAIRLREQLAELNEPVALIAGGGAAANAVRDWSEMFGLDEPTAHWLAVDSLSLTARLVCDLLNRELSDRANSNSTPGTIAEIAADWPSACAAVSRGVIPVLDARGLLTEFSGAGEITLPETWAVTSDSIAAAIAIRWNVPHLVLLKSVARPPDGLLSRDGSARLMALPVDDWFEQLAPRLSTILWCNLRETPFCCEYWRPLAAAEMQSESGETEAADGKTAGADRN
ncbi:hypothetical protein GC176_18520 [bacterium]|nr:hypothetical protein [bacterium]